MISTERGRCMRKHSQDPKPQWIPTSMDAQTPEYKKEQCLHAAYGTLHWATPLLLLIVSTMQMLHILVTLFREQWEEKEGCTHSTKTQPWCAWSRLPPAPAGTTGAGPSAAVPENTTPVTSAGKTVGASYLLLSGILQIFANVQKPSALLQKQCMLQNVTQQRKQSLPNSIRDDLYGSKWCQSL